MSRPHVQPPPNGRAHHYVFVHEALRSMLYSDTETFVDYLRGPDGQAGLVRLWKEAGEVVANRGMGADLPAGGLAVECVDGDGWRGAVIHMPKAEELGECALVLVMVPTPPLRAYLWQFYKEKGAPLARLFVLKLLQLPNMDTPGFRLCELSPLLGHVTTGYTCAANTADFVREVVGCFEVDL